MHPKTLKIDPELHRILKSCVSRQARYTIQEYVEKTIYQALCDDYGTATIQAMLNEPDDRHEQDDQLFQSQRNRTQLDP